MCAAREASATWARLGAAALLQPPDDLGMQATICAQLRAEHIHTLQKASQAHLACQTLCKRCATPRHQDCFYSRSCRPHCGLWSPETSQAHIHGQTQCSSLRLNPGCACNPTATHSNIKATQDGLRCIWIARHHRCVQAQALTVHCLQVWAYCSVANQQLHRVPTL